MKEEKAFRAATALLLLAAAAVSGYHRHKAEAAAPERISVVEEEGLPTAALRLSGLALVLSVAAYVINPRWMAWSNVRLPGRVRWAGAVLAAAMLPLSWWVFERLGRNVTPMVATREQHELVTAGPFRWAANVSDVHPDEPIGDLGQRSPYGNHVVLKIGDRRYAVLAHFEQGSSRVGEVARAGRPADRSRRAPSCISLHSAPTLVYTLHTLPFQRISPPSALRHRVSTSTTASVRLRARRPRPFSSP